MKPEFSAADIAAALGRHAPTPEQTAVIEHPNLPLLVVAGAGAGKTETMAARVVYMVANGLARSEEILGLTFTVKAAGELALRIRRRLQALAASDLIQSLPQDDPRRVALKNIHPTIMTYDAFVGQVINEFGLLLPVEPAARIADGAEQFLLADSLLRSWEAGETSGHVRQQAFLNHTFALQEMMSNHLADPADVEAETRALMEVLDECEQARLSSGRARSDKPSQAYEKYYKVQQERLDLLNFGSHVAEQMRHNLLLTFGEQMKQAVRLVTEHPDVGQEIRSRFKGVFLDEYQDTGHAQRVFLRTLFNNPEDPLAVTAVGDPMQCIYGWRGASAANLPRFTSDFVKDSANTPSDTLHLTKSFRNPAEVLDLANGIADRVQFTSVDGTFNSEKPDSMRQVLPLTSGTTTQGTVHAAWFNQPDDEITWIADHLAREFEQHQEQRKKFTAAVLVRKNRDAEPIADALRARGVPVDMTPDSLTDVPEVMDVLAVLRVLLDPRDDVGLLRILSGPRWQLGLADMARLAERAVQLTPRVARVAPTDPIERLNWVLRQLEESSGQQSVCLADALADPDFDGQIAYTPQGQARLKKLAAELRRLREQALSMSLPDLIPEVEAAIGIRTEVLARQDPGADGAAGTVHLDRLIEEAHNFASHGGDLRSFLDYLDTTVQVSAPLASGEVRVLRDRVQIMTVHRSKGLEWDIVAVPFASTASYVERFGRIYISSPAWTNNAAVIPSSLRGDLWTPEHPNGVPDFTTTAETISELTQNIDEYNKGLRVANSLESDRLFYVAITRCARSLFVSGNAEAASRTLSEHYTHTFKKLVSRWNTYAAAEFKQRTGAPKTKTLATLKTFIKGFDEDPLPPSLDTVRVLWPKRFPSPVLITLVSTMTQAMEREALTRSATAPGLIELTEKDFIDELEARLLTTGVDSLDTVAAELRTIDGATGWTLVDEVTATGHIKATRISLGQWHIHVESPYWMRDGRHLDPQAPTPPTWPADPAGASRPILEEAAHLVDTIGPIPTPEGLPTQWEADVTALIEEARATATRNVDVSIGSELTTSDMINIAADADSFARRRLRPLPFKPNLYAKRGTAFHNWLEERAGGSMALIDEDDLMTTWDEGEEALMADEPALAALKDAFERSDWADRVPTYVELPFTVRLGGFFIRGRMDAVFHDGEDPHTGWTIIDWKTGRKPEGAAMRRAAIQLGVYRLALVQFLEARGIPDPQVVAAFHYVRTNETYTPATLPGQQQLEQLLGELRE